jgi:RNase H-like domain found in reverse transcriptase
MFTVALFRGSRRLLRPSTHCSVREKLDPPILALPRAEGLFTLNTDASQNQIGCCLFQEQPDGSKYPVVYWSMGLTSTDKSYSTTEKECLAIVWAILQLRPYLDGKRFFIRTDHNSLRWVLNLAAAQGRLARWILRLLEFDFEVQYSPGKARHGADTMSRLPSTDPEIKSPLRAIDTEIPFFTVEAAAVDHILLLVENLREIQTADPSCCIISTLLGAHLLVEYDELGAIGRLLHGGHFEPQLPNSCARQLR